MSQDYSDHTINLAEMRETKHCAVNIVETRRVPVQRAAAVERDEIPYP